ncbi:MAG: ThiF family adenylyltransferase, partial [Acidobacteria bacterium]|nr:ThiF family adenylyltransferase [Acidobacteriota bacterium]
MTQGSSQQLVWYRWAPKTHSRTGIHFEDSTSQLTKTAKSLDLNLALSGARLSLSALKRLSVAVFGLGAVGGEILTALARLGVGRLIGIDAGRYREDSWRTQPVFPEHAGQAKAWIQGLRARSHNPAVEVWAAIGR